MVYFNCDYMAGAHPQVLRALCDTNFLKTVGYGDDHFTSEAKDKILRASELDEGVVFFLEGDTSLPKVDFSPFSSFPYSPMAFTSK